MTVKNKKINSSDKELKWTPVYRFALREDLKDNPSFIPTRADDKATGWDVKSSEDLVIKPFEHFKIHLGFRALCPDGWWFQLVPRSSTFGKKDVHALYGTIDETYEGELIFAGQYIPSMKLVTKSNSWDNFSVFDLGAKDLVINAGDAVGQIIPVQREEMIVESISNAEYDEYCEIRNSVRGAGGFGSTDKK